MSMPYIQKIPSPGTGPVLYPDAAMDAGTRGLIDTFDAWPWGGTLPATGLLSIPAGRKLLNYAFDAVGADASPATVVDAAYYNYSGVAVLGQVRVRMPDEFMPKASDADIGWSFWVLSNPPADASGWHNSFLYSNAGGALQVRLVPTYTSGVMTGLELIAIGFAGSLLLPESVRTTLSDGHGHNIGIRIMRGSANGTMQFYLDGTLVADTGVVATTAGWTNPTTADGMYIGRDPSLGPVGTGIGLEGYFWRGIVNDFSRGKLDAPTWFAREWNLNKTRIF